MQVRASIICPNCENVSSLDFYISDDARFHLVRLKDIYSGHEISISCSACEVCYTAYIAEDESELTMFVPEIEKSRYRITHLNPDFLSDFNHELSECSLAFRQLIAAIDDSTYLYRSYEPNTERATDAFLRMLFTQMISALETYLADTLIAEVQSARDSTIKLLQKEETLSQEKITLLEAYTNWNIVENRVKRHLRGILYHNLPKVDALYSIAFDIGLPYKDKNHKTRLNRAMAIRHDCVHRNGKTPDGKRIELTGEFYKSTITDIISLSSSLEDLLINFRASNPESLIEAIPDYDFPF